MQPLKEGEIMTDRCKRQPRGKEYIAITMRYSKETYEKIRRYAYQENTSMAMANEELIRKGLEYNSEAKR